MSFPYQITSLEQYHEIYKQSIENPEKFWGNIASYFRWKKPFDSVLEWNFEEPKVEWFNGSELNITENCLDRWAETQPNTTAIIWEPNHPNEGVRKISYNELLEHVCQFAQVLKNNGAKKGDRICIYMPMVPELAIAVLACARIGAIHSVIFGGFSAQSIVDRMNDATCNIVITADGAYRGNKEIELKSVIDEALEFCPSVKKIIVLERTKVRCSMLDGRDVWWHDEITKIEHSFCEAEVMNSEDKLFILYTSGSTGKPKGVVHSCAGYMVYTNYTFVNVFQYQPNDIFFCTADVGWITGHSYIIYGPLSAGATTLMFEGIPTFPDAGRLWEIVEKHKVNILYTAPTAIRSLMGFGTSFIEGKDLSSLKVLGSVGEPINEEAWHWYYEHIGKGKCPIVDTWWQTETGGIMISNLAGITPHKPAHATWPLPGIKPLLVDELGNEIIGNKVSGNLCISQPWPSIIRTTYGDHERCKQAYFSTYKNLYFTGDGCLRDEDGNYRITGRVDDVLNVSGHRIGTAEVENAINEHPAVIESAIVGYPHDIKGQGIYAFVILNSKSENEIELRKEIHQTVSKIIGAIAKPDKIQFVTGLPKTRSGKIMRRILRKIAEGETENLGDTSTLLDPSVVEEIKKGKL
jgi:acetyl-CoA synthetase